MWPIVLTRMRRGVRKTNGRLKTNMVRMFHCRADFPHLLETPSCTDVIRKLARRTGPLLRQSDSFVAAGLGLTSILHSPSLYFGYFELFLSASPMGLA